MNHVLMVVRDLLELVVVQVIMCVLSMVAGGLAFTVVINAVPGDVRPMAGWMLLTGIAVGVGAAFLSKALFRKG